MASNIRFLLPPSLGPDLAAGHGQRLADFASRACGQPVEVSVAASYETLAKDVLAGRVDAAWAPPFVCARVESMGARIVVRGVRNGVSAYRAALVCREDKALNLSNLAGTRAAWVDPDSIAGHLLATAFLKSKGIDPLKTFFRQEYLGSYRAALEAVVSGTADVTSVFAPAGTHEPHDATGIHDVAPDLASRFKVIAFTDEAPSDGVAVSPSADPEKQLALERMLLTLHETADGAALVKHLFHADSFEPAPRMGYRALYRVALATL